MRRVGKIVTWVAAIMAVLLVLIAVVGVWAVRRAFPDYNSDVAMPGLTAEVEVVRNAQGVPTVWADTPEDLFRAQGYLHAQDRFFEMDMRRHITAGRLSELFGDSQLDTDKFLRTLGWRRVAEAEVPLLSPEARMYYEAYAAGVNAYLGQRSGGELSLAYTLLGVQGVQTTPEPWTVADSLAWFKALAWDLRGNLEEETERAVLAATLPPERIDQLFPPFPYDRQSTILSDADVKSAADQKLVTPLRSPSPLSVETAASMAQLQRLIRALPAAVGTGEGVGSNSWVVSGSRTASGKPLLANDPHLAPSLPSVWTQVSLRCRVVNDACPFDVQGFSFSGLPGVLIGHTDEVAWGLTTTYADTMDLYLEKVDGQTYLTENGAAPLATRVELIKVAGGDDVELTVRSTRHGPLISDVSDGIAQVGIDGPVAPADQSVASRDDGYSVALRWASLEPGLSGEAIFAMNKAQNFAEFRAASDLLESPVQNLVYADAAGNIGYQVNGKIPIRTGYDGRDAVPGWTGEYDWTGWLSVDQRPHVENPAVGYLATANENPVPENYPHLITTDPGVSYRGDRIRELLESNTSMDNAASNAIAMDTQSGLAEYLVPILLDVQGLRAYYDDGQELLADWDYQQPPDSAAAAYFNSVWSNLLRLTFHDEMPEAFWPSGSGRWFEVIRVIMADPLDPFWDDITTDNVIETREQILQTAMIEARDDLTRRLGKDPATWEWGRLHKLLRENDTFGQSGIAPIEALFNRGSVPVGGGSAIVLANGWDAATGYEVTSVPSMRMQVDFGDLNESQWVHLTGQSGHPFHEFYLDQNDKWRLGETFAMRWLDDARRAEATTTMRLTPSSPGASPDN